MRDRYVGLHDAAGQSACQRTPSLAAIDRLENAAAGTVPAAVFPRPLARLPQCGIDNIGIGRIDLYVTAANVLVFVEHLLEALAAVSRAIDSTLGVGSVRMPHDGNKQAVGIA